MVDVPNNTSTTATLAFGGTYNGEIEVAGDEDWVAVTLQAGVTYAIQMTGSTIGDGTLVDPFIKGLYNASGTSLNRFDDDGAGSRNSQLVFTPNTSGTYYVSAGGWETETGTYQMSLEEYEAEAPSPTTNAVVDQVDITGDDRVDSLLDLFRYQNVLGAATTTVTYSFPNASSAWSTSSNGGYGPEDGDGEPWNGISFLTTSEENLFKDALSQIESFAAVTFEEVDDNTSSAGTIRVTWTDEPDADSAAYAYTPYGTVIAGDIWIVSENQSTGGRGSYFQLVLTHELGHAMGLKHPFDDDGSGVILSSAYDGLEYTVMSYNVSIEDEDIAGASFYPTSYMYLDILALQHLYGEAENEVGNTTYTFSNGTQYYETIWDTGGTDTYDASSQTTGLDLDLTPGSWSDVGTTITLYRDGGPNSAKTDTVYTPPEVTIENAIGGSGSDRITGNSAANVLTGGGGHDNMRGQAGGDMLSGGSGDDTLRGNEGDDALYGGSGADFLRGNDGDDIAEAGSGDDRIYAGGDGNDTVRGDEGDDYIGGGDGADLLIGDGADASFFSSNSVGQNGADVMYGSSGNDTVIGTSWDDDGDGVVEVDEIVTSASDGDNFQWGGSEDDFVYGGGGADTVRGGPGDDAVYGFGGNDRVYGGKGVASDARDTLSGGAGNDSVYGSTGDDSVSGDTGDDLIFGGTEDDVIDGGSGSDELWGGSGDDTITGGTGDDEINTGGGSDELIFTSGHGDDVVTDFSTSNDLLDLSGTTTDFTSAASVQAAATNTTVSGEAGVMIDTGGGDSIFLIGLTTANLATVDYTF